MAAVAAIALLTSCTGDSNAAGDDDVITVTLWDQKGGDASTALDALVADFNSSQDRYRVQRQFIAGNADQFASQIQNAVRTGETPDLVFGDSNATRIGSLVESGAIVDLEPYFGAGEYPVEQDDLYPGMLQMGVFGGATYAVPTDGGSYALIYNTQHFRDAGIDDPPETWDELRSAAAALSTDGRYGIYLPIGAGEWSTFTWLAMLWSAGGQFLDEDFTRAEFDSPEGIEALTAWTDLVADGSAYPTSLVDDSQQTGLPGFTAGQVSMFIGRPGDLAVLDDAMGEGVAGVVPLPVIDQPAVSTGVNLTYLFKGSEQTQNAAWAFVSWALQPDQQAAWAIATGFLPTSTRTAASDEWQARVAQDPRISVFVDALDTARPRPSIPEYAAISTSLATQIEGAMLGQRSPQEALRTAQAEADAILAK